MQLIKCYKYTGFDYINRPDGINTLENSTAAKPTYEANVVQNMILGYVDIYENYDQSQAIDYVRVGITGSNKQAYYYVTNVVMMSETVSRLMLELDGILTCASVGSGWTATATRLTQRSKDDYNYLQEPWSPAEPLEYIDTVQITNSDAINLVGCTVALSSATAIAKSYADANGIEQIYVPQVQAPEFDTKIEGMGRSYNLPNELLYDADATQVKSGLATLQSLGLLDSVLHRYVLPLRYADVKRNIIGTDLTPTQIAIDKLTGVSEEVNGPNCDHGTTYQPNNTKANVLYSSVIVYGESSGDANEYSFGEITKSGEKPSFTLESDPSPQGRPIIRPTYYMKRKTVGTEQATKGSQWFSPQMNIYQAEGTKRSAYDVKRSNVLAVENYALDQTETAARGLGALFDMDFKGAGGALGEMATRGIRDFQAYNDRESEQRQAENVFTPRLLASNGESSQLLLGNGFKLIGQNLTVEDMKKFDRYLTKFGQAVPSINVKSADLLNIGKRFCYIEASSVAFTGNAPRYVKEIATKQITGGVRLWHQRPNFDYYEGGNI